MMDDDLISATDDSVYIRVTCGISTSITLNGVWGYLIANGIREDIIRGVSRAGKQKNSCKAKQATG